MSVITSCPGCGMSLQPVSLDPDTPPWVCPNCSRGWWNAELTTSARRRYDPLLRHFGTPDQAVDIHDQVGAEHDGRVKAHGRNPH